jgi:large subunit ribosomal protein L30
MGKIRITLKRSLIGTKPVHVKTAHALGLRKIGASVQKELNAPILGMVKSIAHMVEVEEIK